MLGQHADYRYIRGLLENDDIIVTEIYQIFQPKVINYVTRNSGKKGDGEDVFQKALIVILEKARRDNFHLRSRFESFLMGISQRIWLNDLRGGKCRQERKSVDDLNDMFFDKKAIKEQVEQEQREEREQGLKRIRQYVSTYPDRKQLILYLRLYRELNFKEIASLMDYSSENSARQAYFRIISDLRDNFRDDNDNNSDDTGGNSNDNDNSK